MEFPIWVRNSQCHWKQWSITHPNAFGLGIMDSNFDAFVQYADTKLKDIEFYPNYKVDFIYSSNTMNPNDILEIGGMEALWGQNVEEPLVVIENLAVTKDMLQLMARDRNPTLKITLPNGISCIKFKSSDEEFENLFSESGCAVITIIGRCKVNRYYNSVTPQIIIENYEVVTKQDYYF